jgi:hypothetical protein
MITSLLEGSMGTLLGNIFAVVLIVIAGLLGAISLEASAITFIVIPYGFWLLLSLMNFSASRTISEAFQMCLSEVELQAFRRYNIHIGAPGTDEIFAALLNLLRLADLFGLVCLHGKATMFLPGYRLRSSLYPRALS